MSDLRLALSAGNVEYRLEPKMARSCAFHEAQPYGLTDFTEVAGALGENRPIRHPFFAGQPITSATVNLSRGMQRRWESGNDRLHCGFEAFYACFSHQPSFKGGRTP
jgi:hypothetical protein